MFKTNSATSANGDDDREKESVKVRNFWLGETRLRNPSLTTERA